MALFAVKRGVVRVGVALAVTASGVAIASAAPRLGVESRLLPVEIATAVTEPESGASTTPSDLAASFVSIPHVDGVAALLAALKTPVSVVPDVVDVPEAASVSSTQPVETPDVVAPAPAIAEPEPGPEPEPEPEPEPAPIVSPTYLSTLVATIVPDVTLLAPVTEPGGTELVVYDPTTAWGITNPTYFGSPLKLRVVQRSDDGEWLRVQLPVRPNHTTGWIPTSQATLSSTSMSVRVDLTTKKMHVWDGSTLALETQTTIGAPGTPTPLGTFFVNDHVAGSGSYGPHFLSLSACSETLETFNGGVPVIAIHGTNRPDLIDGAHSNGCVRVTNDIVTQLKGMLPVGTPVQIVQT
jgi:lipoprotein-anchoring transpeptidase ErfK/SrfK